MTLTKIQTQSKLRQLLQKGHQANMPTINPPFFPQEDTSDTKWTVRKWLEVSQYWYNQGIEHAGAIFENIDDEVAFTITPEITDRVNEMIDHYQRKMFPKKMSGEASDWENAIGQVLADPDRMCKNNQTRLLVTLPHFYTNELHTSDVIQGFESVPKDAEFHTNEGEYKTLRYINNINISNSRRKARRYFFTDETNIFVRDVSLHEEEIAHFLDIVFSVTKNTQDFVIDAKSRKIAEGFNAYSIDCLIFRIIDDPNFDPNTIKL